MLGYATMPSDKSKEYITIRDGELRVVGVKARALAVAREGRDSERSLKANSILTPHVSGALYVHKASIVVVRVMS